MNSIAYNFNNTTVSQEKIDEGMKKLIPEIERLQRAHRNGYDSEYASINLATDNVMQQAVTELIDQTKGLKPTAIVVCGIGGSVLGTQALQEAVLGKFYNIDNPGTKIYYADTVDADNTYHILKVIKNELEQGNAIILNVVSKSGKTIETVANFQVFLDLLIQYFPNDYYRYVFATTDRDSDLWQVAQESKFQKLEIPRKVGGRYSVLSPVGLFPLGLIGFDSKQLCVGAAAAVTDCVSLDKAINIAAHNAVIIHELFTKGYAINDLFLFSSDLEGVGKWYRQMVGESLGKEFDRDNNKVASGIDPTVSLGTVDLHAVGQLYLAGTQKIFTTFVSLAHTDHQITIPDTAPFGGEVATITGRQMSDVMDAILQGVQRAYAERGLPYAHVTLEKKSAYALGYFLQYKMIEMMYLGFLLHIDPFDQPNVELYKAQTRKILNND